MHPTPEFRRPSRFFPLILLALAIGIVDLPVSQSAAAGKEGVRIERDVEFLDAGRKERADLYLPMKAPSRACRPVALGFFDQHLK